MTLYLDRIHSVLENPRDWQQDRDSSIFSTSKAESTLSFLSSSPFRAVKNHAMFLPWYADASLDDSANAFGSRVRNLLCSTDGLASNRLYVSLPTPLSSLIMPLLLS